MMPKCSTLISRYGAGALALGIPAVLLVTTVLSWPALSGPFLFDDFPNLEHLATLNGRLDWASLANYASLYRSEPGRPLSMLSFVINDFDWPSSPWPFKYTNLMLHLLIGVLIFGFTRTLARLRTTAAPHADIIALLTTAAWLLHPMQLSTSMLVVQRMTQMSALFVFAGLWGYVVLAQRARNAATALAAILALGIGTVLAVLSKETGALAPLLAIVINATFLRERLRQLPVLPRRLLQLGTLLPVLALLTGIAAKLNALPGYGGRSFDLVERLLSQSRALCDYLFNILVPSLRGGGIYHDDFAISHGLLTPWTTLPAALCISGLLFVALLAYRRWPLFAFAVLWFFCAHLLESTIFPLELYFEHRNYLPMFGIFLSLAIWIIEKSKHGHGWLLALAWCWIAFAAWLTSVQAPIWGNRDALVTVWAIEHPQSPRAVQEKSAYYYRKGQNAEAAATLLDGYARGVRGSDFPVQVLLLACATHDKALANRTRPLLPTSLGDGEFNRATAVTLSKFRRQVQANICPEVLTEDGWLWLTATLLENPKYSAGTVAAYLYIERAYLYQHRRDLNATMFEFEKAWAANPTPELAHLMAATLASAGLYDQAEIWAKRAFQHRTRGIRGWLAQDDVKSKRILEALQAAQQPRSP